MKCDHEIDDLVGCDEQATRFFLEKGVTLLRGSHGRLSKGEKWFLVGFCERHIPWAIRPSSSEFVGGMREITAEEAAIWEVQNS